MWSDHVLDGWRCRLNLPMFLLVISVGRDWSVHSVLEFSAMEKNLRIISDLILMALIIGDSSLEPLLESLLAQIHIDLS